MNRTEPMTETMFSNWRAVAIDNQGREHLIFNGSSFSNVTAGYAVAFNGVLTLEEQKNIKQVNLQRWNGVADRGSWVNKKTLPIPEAAVEEKETISIAS